MAQHASAADAEIALIAHDLRAHGADVVVVPRRCDEPTVHEMTVYEKRLADYKRRRSGILRTAEVAAGAALGTALHNKLSAGVAFGAGIALNVLAYTPIGEEFADHLTALGDGCVASYVTILMLPKPPA